MLKHKYISTCMLKLVIDLENWVKIVKNNKLCVFFICINKINLE